MRLRDRTPDLPHGEGELYAHESSGEHAPRFSGIENEYNPLREAELLPRATNNIDVAGITSFEIRDMLSRGTHDLIIAHQIDAANQPNRLVGMAIGRRVSREYENRMTVKELVVHPEMRRRHVASYLLGRLTQNVNPTEMVVETDRFVPENWFVEGLKSAGFNHQDEHGSPAIWLPGQRSGATGNLNSRDFVEGFERHIPDGWNGHKDFFPQDDPQTRIYRNGKRVGIVRHVNDRLQYDSNLNDHVGTFTITDAGDVRLDTITEVTEKEAMIAVLNAYDLVPDAA